MGPLQHHCEMAALAEEKSTHEDYAASIRSQEGRASTPGGIQRASIILSSSDAARSLTYAPMSSMSWTTSATATPPNIIKDLDTSAARTAVVLPKRQKKDPQPIPDNRKDEAYWEKRKKNNESAKRSRVLRRVKEQQTAMKVAYLEQENVHLKAEVTMLRNELDKMRQLLMPKIEYLDKGSNGNRN